MAKKTTKRVVKEEATTEESGVSAAEKALIEEAEGLSDEEAADIVDVGKQFKPPQQVEDIPGQKAPEAGQVDRRKVKIRLSVPVKVARVEYSTGVHEIERHQLPVFREIVSKKIKSDLSMFTGKNYIIERLLDRTLVITEAAGEINLAKLGR